MISPLIYVLVCHINLFFNLAFFFLSQQGKVVGKQSLLRTLQTLGSVPDWGAGNVLDDSDEEKDVSTTVKTVKKKRCKKRKRKSNAENEGKQQDKVDSTEPPVKKKKPVKKTIKQTSENMF